MPIRGRYIDVEGVRTYFEQNHDEASGAGLPAVCAVHIAGRESRQYYEMMEILEGEVRLAALDMPAHGKSSPLPGNLAIDDWRRCTDFIWSFMRAAGLEGAAAMGCSLGGNLMFDLASRHPVKAVIALQGLDHTPSISAVARRFMNHPHVSLQHSHLRYSLSLAGRAAGAEAMDFIKWGVRQEIAVAKKADLTMYNGFDVRESMGDVRCPVLMVRGADDWIVDELSNREAMARLTGAKPLVYRELPGVCHFPAVEAPRELCSIITEFLRLAG